MENKQTDQNKMENYLTGRISYREKKTFEDRLAADPKFKEEFEDYKLERNALKVIAYNAYLKEIKKNFDEANTSLNGNSTLNLAACIEPSATTIKEPKPQINRPESKRRFLYWLLPLAATVCLAIISYLGFDTRNGDDLLEIEHFQNYSFPQTASGYEFNKDSLKRAFAEYDNKKYERALHFFQEIPDTQKNQDRILFYEALCQFKLGRWDEGILNMDKVLKNEDNTFLEPPAHWYLALGYLKKGQNKDALQYLDKVKTNNWYNAKKATIILQTLNDTKQ